MVVEIVLKFIYMDDSMDLVFIEEDRVIFYRQLLVLWEKVGMYVRKWLLNLVGVLQYILLEDVVFEVDLYDNSLLFVKIFGVLWKVKDDIFIFKVSLLEDDFIYIKWNFLWKIVMLFDFLGFLGLYIIRVKVLL